MDEQKDQEDRSPVDGTTEFWLSVLRSRLSLVNNDSPESLPALHNVRTAIASVLAIVDARINASAHVSRLPTELLTAIFSHLVIEEMHESNRGMDCVPPTVPWVRVAWVCHRWRHVMLTSPALWCHFVLPLPPQWARAMLARSQRLPLLVSCSSQHGYHQTNLPWWRLPFDTLERVKTFDLLYYNGSFTDIAMLLSKPAPLLEVVIIPQNMPRRLPLISLFANCAPNLRKLVVYNVLAFQWASLFIPNLIDLNLYIDSDQHSQDLPFILHFVAALQRLSRLKTLTLALDSLRPFSTSLPDDAFQIAQITSLRKLELVGSLPRCVEFLRHIQLPDTVKLYVASLTGGVSDFAALYPFLAPMRDQPYRDIHFRSTAVYGLLLKASHTECGPPSREVEYEWTDPNNTVVDFMPALEVIGVHHLSFLSISLDVHLGRGEHLWPMLTELLDTFGEARELQKLEGTGYTGGALCLALNASRAGGTWRRSASAADGTILWPRLRELRLLDTDLPYSIDNENGNVVADNNGRVCSGNELLDALERRHQLGTALDTLYLVSCSFQPQWLHKVEAVVGRVVGKRWDEYLDGCAGVVLYPEHTITRADIHYTPSGYRQY
ncbi:hypothetical protein FA95DRAFT_1609939 [Auriscalpium vulgare]|uniref:Uncharacterized protein n=1 Tax=Auriscalpium vulgare TaxID=40419 RepID=A0ACB8RFD2_9AGAM|nr:hypothetical protein FA95DRAFT_1609939 [Auriscalpium vulgare]